MTLQVETCRIKDHLTIIIFTHTNTNTDNNNNKFCFAGKETCTSI
jgi:hypothetical protein